MKLLRISLSSLLVVCAAMLALPALSHAGRLVATGHDIDDHCQRNSQQCNFLALAIAHARGGAPDPSDPVLGLDCNGDLPTALDKIALPTSERVIKCPSKPSDAFATDPLSATTYSAIVVGSSCGRPPSGRDSINATNHCDEPGGTLPDSDALLARKADIKQFFDAGGGIVALSGERNGDGNPSTGPDSYYSFLPIPVEGKVVKDPFTLTGFGAGLGLIDGANASDSDINCCETHNAFAEPGAGVPLDVAERDANGSPETLWATLDATPAPKPTPTPTVTQQTSGPAPAAPPTPVAGQSVVVGPSSGNLRVKLPGSKEFESLTGLASVPVGSTVDANNGVASLTSAADQSGGTQTADFWAGRFRVQQKLRQNLITDIVLTGGRKTRCASQRQRSVFTGRNRHWATASRRRRKRKLWGSGKGRFRTRGKHSAATVRGTKWLTSDSCAGTRTKVKRGVVKVRDFTEKKTIKLHAGQAYLARP